MLSPRLQDDSQYEDASHTFSCCWRQVGEGRPCGVHAAHKHMAGTRPRPSSSAAGGGLCAFAPRAAGSLWSLRGKSHSTLYTRLGPCVSYLRLSKRVCTTFCNTTVKRFILLHFFLYSVSYFTVGSRFQIKLVKTCRLTRFFLPPARAAPEPLPLAFPRASLPHDLALDGRSTPRLEMRSRFSPGPQGGAGPVEILEVLLVPVPLFCCHNLLYFLLFLLPF
uniref:Uncharacterized protein n=1 Tax=Molossus molossus TaxID=27622 RepID=A0A7J8HI09_MOLMO|nr:hypothetical protein HJG59_010954 [Molossus molossus]